MGEHSENVEDAAIRIISQERGQPFHSEIACFKLGAQWQARQNQALDNRAKELSDKYIDRLRVINSNYKSTNWNNSLKDIEIEILEGVIEDLQTLTVKTIK